jgi:Protoporphyrinogen oxidase
MTGPPVVVLGAGFAGLVAAVELRRLGIDVVVLEASDAVGGLATSHHVDGVSFDTGAHFVTNRLATAIGVMDQCHDAVQYGESVWLDGTSASYPLGLMRKPRYVAAALASRLRTDAPARTAADRFRNEYGRALADEIAIPLLEAWSGLPADELAPSVLDKIPGGIVETIALTAARRVTHRAIAIGYCGEAPQSANVWHVYPRDGLGVFTRHLAAELDGLIQLNTPVEAIHVQDGRVVGVRADGEEQAAAAVVTTLPAPLLPRLTNHPAIAPLAELEFRAMVFVQLRLRGRGLLPAPVTWTPERTLPYFRVTEAPMAMPWLAPTGETILTVDIGARVGDPIWNAEENALAAECLDGLASMIPDVRDRHIGTYSARTPIAYPVFALRTEPARQAISTHGIRGLVSAGRNAEFGHLLMEDVYWRTLRAVRALGHEVAG